MVFEQIEKQKKDFTDKYVVVDGSRPELARFKDVVGQVKTVNMSGRALVEFLDYHLNIGWYDIDPLFLKVVDKPPPKVAKPEEKKPAAKAEAKPAATAKPIAKAPAAAPKAGKPSVADILAAARGGKPTGGKAASAAVKPKPESAPEAPKPAAAAPAKVDRSKMSVADMLAAARAGGAPGAAKTQAKTEPTSEPVAEAPQTTPDGAATSVAVNPPDASTAKPTGKIDKSKMSIDDMLAWCREHDAK